MYEIKVTLRQREDFTDVDTTKNAIVKGMAQFGEYVEVVDIDVEELGDFRCYSCGKYTNDVISCEHCGTIMVPDEDDMKEDE